MVSATPHALSAFESYLSRSFALTLLLSAFLILVCSGELKQLYGPNDSQADALPSATSTTATITLVSTLIYHFLLAGMLYIYGCDLELSSSLMTLGGLVHLVLGVAGLLVVVFRGDGKVSKRTGADKRTSGFPFKNAEASKKHK